MRIGVIGPTWPDGFSAHIIDALAGMGHEAIPLGSASALGGPYTSRWAVPIRNAVPRAEEHMQFRIARAAARARCEIVINIEAGLLPSVVREMRRNGSKVAFWFPDHLANLGRQLMLLAPYDAVFFKEPHLVDRLSAVLDLPLFYLPEACHPRWHRPTVPGGTEPYLVLAGNMYPSRMLVLERLLAKGIPLRLYGPGFPRWVGSTPLRDVHAGRCVFLEEKAQIFRSAAAVLNTMYPAEINGVNARLLEAAGCGAAVLTEYRPAVADLFAVGTEVMVFHEFDELVSQAERLLSESGLTARIGDAAARRAHRDHTYGQRLAVILEKLA